LHCYRLFETKRDSLLLGDSLSNKSLTEVN
jgi:hypothetical protein